MTDAQTFLLAMARDAVKNYINRPPVYRGPNDNIVYARSLTDAIRAVEAEEGLEPEPLEFRS